MTFRKSLLVTACLATLSFTANAKLEWAPGFPLNTTDGDSAKIITNALKDFITTEQQWKNLATVPERQAFLDAFAPKELQTAMFWVLGTAPNDRDMMSIMFTAPELKNLANNPDETETIKDGKEAFFNPDLTADQFKDVVKEGYKLYTYAFSNEQLNVIKTKFISDAAELNVLKPCEDCAPVGPFELLDRIKEARDNYPEDYEKWLKANDINDPEFTVAVPMEGPVVYTNPDGKRVYQMPDGTFNTDRFGRGDNVPEDEVVASVLDPKGTLAKNISFNNIKTNLPEATGAKSMDRPANVNRLTHYAATVGDIMNSGWNLKANDEEKAFVKPYDTVNFVNGEGTTASVTVEGTTSKVTFNVAKQELEYKDGSVAVKPTTPETKGDAYATASNVAEMINQAVGNSTHTYGADSGADFTRTSQETLKIVGGATNTLTEGNIGTVANTDGSISVKLSSELSNLTKVSVGQLEINATSNKITGLEAGEISENSKEAVNGSQLHAVKNDITALQTGVKAAKSSVKAGDNINVSESTGTDGQTIYTVSTATDVDFDKVTVGNITLDKTTHKITGLADGEVSETSKEAVNGSQLHAVKQDITQLQKDVKDAKAATSSVKAGDNINVSKSTGDNGETVFTVKTADEVNFTKVTVGSVMTANNKITGLEAGEISENSKEAVNGSQLFKLEEKLSNPLTFKGDKGEHTPKAGTELHIKGDGKNLSTEMTDNQLVVSLNNNLEVSSVTTGNAMMSNNGFSAGAVQVTNEGLDNGGNVIRNVAPGREPTDAVNVSQLKQVVSGFEDRLNKIEGGIANNAALASLPQSTMSGRAMFAMGVGNYGNKTALAVGVSHLSNNGRVAFKLNAAANTTGRATVGAGVGFHW